MGERPKNTLTGAVILLTALTLFIGSFFIIGWYNHSKMVQGWVQESVENFRKEDIDWTDFDPNDDTEILLQRLRTVLTENTMVFRTDAIIDENAAYMETIYDLIRVLVNEPDNGSALLEGMLAAQSAQTKFYVAVDEFLSSRFVAMRATI